MNNDLSDKELLQAKHRLEEAQARNRQKERKARTRRLIQEGAILENVLPEIKHMNPEEIKAEGCGLLKACLERGDFNLWQFII